MKDGQVFSSNRGAGIHRRSYVDKETGALTVETEQDVTEIVEDSKGQFNQFDERTPMGGDGLVKVASIPLSVLFTKEMQKIRRDPAAYARWLDDPDNRVFRTRPGRVSFADKVRGVVHRFEQGAVRIVNKALGKGVTGA